MNIIYQVLNGILQGNFGRHVLHDSVWSLQSLFVAAPLLWYYWQTIRMDQRHGAEAVAQRKIVTLLATDPGGQLAARLAARLGYRVKSIYPAAEQAGEQPMVPDEELERAVREIDAAAAPSLMLIVSGEKIAVHPYRER